MFLNRNKIFEYFIVLMKVENHIIILNLEWKHDWVKSKLWINIKSTE